MKKLLCLLALAALPATAETVAITGGKVVTLGPAGTIDGGTVVIRDGRIASVGRDVAAPGASTRPARSSLRD
jgi:imidazolonepropionase-like amidohydrolase